MATEAETTVTDATTTATEPEPVEMTAEELKAELAKERAEKKKTADALKKANESDKNRRLRLEELEAAEAERANAKLSEDEKARQRNAERDQKAKEAEERAAKAEQALVNERVDRAVERAAHDAGFLYPGDIPRLIDRDRIEIDPETGKMTGVKEAVERLAKDRPNILIAQRGAGSPAAIPARGGANGNIPPKPEVEQDLRRVVRYP